MPSTTRVVKYIKKGDKGDKGDAGASYTDNLLLKSNVPVSNGSYVVANYDLAEKPVLGETYTFTLWGQLAQTRTSFQVWNSGGMVHLATLAEVSEGVYTASFVWKNVNGGYIADDTFIRVFAFTNTQSGVSSISKVKLEKGINTNPQWTPAASELKGDKGPLLRGPQAWSDLPVGYHFYAGAENEQYVDVVLWQGNYYYCKNSHVKTGTNNPLSDSTLWTLGDKLALVAAKIVLTEYALVKNLGVETIEMKDTDGNILFQAKDGEVTCNTGNFKHVNVSGDITVEQLNLKIKTDDLIIGQGHDGAILINKEAISLPELPEGTCRVYKVLNHLMTRGVETDFQVTLQTPNVRFAESASSEIVYQEFITLSGKGLNSGTHMEFIGYHQQYGIYAGKTIWIVSYY